jgi:ribose transport system permease protein
MNQERRDRGHAAREVLWRIAGSHEFFLFVVLLAAGTALHFASDKFLSPTNISAMLLGLAVESIVAVGMTILLVSGGFDLSVGSTMALSGAMTAMALVHGVPVPAAVLVGLAVGAGIGEINGLVIALLGINPFIATLAMMSAARGLLLVLTEGVSITGLPPDFTSIGQSKPLGVQLPIWICLGLVVVFDFLLRRSRFLRQNYYIGGNEKAAFLCGIPVARIKMFNYTLTGLLAAVAGIVSAARFGAASVTAGTQLELKVITAVVIGGASLGGGTGTILGAFLGSCLMALISDAIAILGVDANWNQLVVGLALFTAVLIDTLNRRRKGLL